MKKIISIFLVGILLVTVSGCSIFKNKNAENTTVYVSENGDSFIDVSDYEESTKPEVEIINSISGWGKIEILNVVGFSEGLAWIHYKDKTTNEYETAVINGKGELIYIPNDIVKIYAPFDAGYSFYASNNNEYKIIDSKGNVTATSNDGQFESIIAAGAGMFVVQKKYSNVSTNEVYWAVIDGKGEYLVDYFTAPYYAYYDNDNIYFGKNYFRIGDHVSNDEAFDFHDSDVYVINLKDGSITEPFEDYATPKIVENYDNEKVFVSYTHYYYHGIYSLDKNFNKTYIFDKEVSIEAYDTKAFKNMNHIFSDLHDYYGHSTSGFSEGLFYYNGAYYDYDGKYVFTIDGYESNHKFGGKYKNGYAPLFIYGVDNNKYVTIIDKQGKIQFEPIAVEDAWIEFDNNGKLLIKKDGAYKLLDNKGNISNEVGISKYSYYNIKSYSDGVLVLCNGLGEPKMIINMYDGTKTGS